MNEFVEGQNVLTELKKNIDLMSRQLDFLIRNSKPLTRLDVDVLMERTHLIYGLVCSAPCTGEPAAVEEENAIVVAPPAKPVENRTKKTAAVQQKEAAAEKPAEPVAEEKTDEPEVTAEQPQTAVEEKPAEQPETKAVKPEKAETPVAEQITLADRMAQQEDNTLAARLQRKPIRDLNKAITLQEQFYFVDELFGGSMEKYKKSINMLNEVPTLSGANVCMNELKIELQWSSSSEAYKKLNNLVVRRFDA